MGGAWIHGSPGSFRSPLIFPVFLGVDDFHSSSVFCTVCGSFLVRRPCSNSFVAPLRLAFVGRHQVAPISVLGPYMGQYLSSAGLDCAAWRVASALRGRTRDVIFIVLLYPSLFVYTCPALYAALVNVLG